MEIRCFLAFELPRDIRDVVFRVSQEVRRFPLDVRWVQPKSMHLTVVFLGQIKEAILGFVGDIASSLCQASAPFSLQLKGMGVFGGIRHPRVLYLGLTGDRERMARFRNDLQAGLEPLGIPQETRPYAPHLTLGRFRGKGAGPQDLSRILESYQDLSSSMCPLYELVLFKSDLKKTGAEYTPIASWPLSGQEEKATV